MSIHAQAVAFAFGDIAKRRGPREPGSKTTIRPVGRLDGEHRESDLIAIFRFAQLFRILYNFVPEIFGRAW
jgi:hypothetical protein